MVLREDGVEGKGSGVLIFGSTWDVRAPVLVVWSKSTSSIGSSSSSSSSSNSDIEGMHEQLMNLSSSYGGTVGGHRIPCAYPPDARSRV